ncbi:MAG: MFS transporter [Coriobacteriales bacterium]|jgi:DHA3 family macrolide efflux protein-like MFS transporter|nr:MFS transporter [Coriobacteriales bacterium]
MRHTWQRTVALFLVGQAITLFGTMITGHAISWYVTLQTQSGTVLTLFTVAMMVPMALSSPLGGVWADRYNRKYLINLVDGAIALVTLVMALFFSAGFEWLGLLFVCVVIRGFGQGIQMPTVTAILPDIVPPDQLVRVNGFNASIQSLSMFASPMIAAALLTFFPIQILMYIDVVTAAIGIAIVFFFVHTHKGMRRIPGASATAGAAAGGGGAAVGAGAAGAAAGIAAAGAPDRPGFLSEFKAGLRYMWRNPFILAFTLLSIVFSILATPPSFLTPLQVVRDFGADPWRLGAIEVAFAVGMMAGGVLIGIWGGFKNRTWSMALATTLFGAGTIGLGLLGNFWVYLGCMLFVGITLPVFNAPSMAILQARVDPDYMGRVFSVSMMAGSLAMPVGMVVFGPLADVVSIDWLLVGTGAGIMLLGACVVASRTLRQAGLLPEPPIGTPVEMPDGETPADPTVEGQ